MKYDIILLGGGIIGVTCAYHLARAGLRPLLIEPAQIAAGTTSASFAWANGSTKTQNRAYHNLNVAGMQAHRRLMQEFGGQALGINPAGALQIVQARDISGLQALQNDAAILADFGYNASLIDTTTLRALEPGLQIADDSHALDLPDDMIIDAPHFTHFLAARMCDLGGAILHATPTALIADDNGQVSGVETSQGPHYAPAIICTAGKDTGTLLADLTGYPPFASRFPLREVPGLILTTPPLAKDHLTHLIYTSTTAELHILPTPNGGLKIGSDDIDAMIWQDRDAATLQKAGHALLTRAERFFPGLTSRISAADCDLRVGIRPYPEDGHSLIGALPGAHGLYVIATHSGITLAPIIAEHMTAWMRTGTRPDALQPYDLTRFPGFNA